MSRRLDLPIAALAWFGGFAWVGWKGSWEPLAALAVRAAAQIVRGVRCLRGTDPFGIHALPHRAL